MHALILGLVHERLDPALVVAHAAEAGEMVDRGADHPRHRGDRFQNDSTVAVTLGEKGVGAPPQNLGEAVRSEEHTSELQSLMRISYAVFCLKKKNIYKVMTTP